MSAIFLSLGLFTSAEGLLLLTRPGPSCSSLRHGGLCLGAKKIDEDASLGLKAAWLGTEAIGWAAGAFRDKATDGVQVATGPPKSLQEASARLKEDYERDYFVSGLIDRELYAPECYFSDPFAGFSGRERFIDNLRNLGTFITGAELRMLNYEEALDASPPTITTRLMVKLQLNLPWNPVLAWPWGVRHEFSPSNQIMIHEESWSVSAAEGLSQVFRPAPKSVLNRIKRLE